jgi:multidrug resistance efflux pump
MKRSAAVAIVVVVVVAGVAWWHVNGGSRHEIAAGGYVEAEQIQVGSKLGGRVVEVRVDEGTAVEANQVLVVLETHEVQAQLDEARADHTKANARLAELRAGARPEEIDQAAARVDRIKEKLVMLQRGPRPQEIEQARLLFERSRAEYENASAVFQRQVGLAERNATSQETLDTARKAMEVALRVMDADRQKYDLIKEGNRPEEIAMAKHELEEAESAHELVRKGPRTQEIEQAEAALVAAAARVRRLDVLLQEGTVKAPLPSIVEAFDLQPGDLVAPGAPIATLVRKDQLWVRAFVAETDLGLVADNQRVSVTVDSFPGRRFTGTVLRVNRIAEFTPRNVQTYKERQDMMFPLKIRVDDPDGVLRPGMAATAHVTKKS